MIEALLWVLNGYVRGCHAVSRGLQRAFVVNKWAVGLGAYALGWMLWLLQAPSWAGLVFLLLWCAYCLYMERATIAWCWAGLRADRPDPDGAVPAEVARCFQIAMTWSLTTGVCVPLYLSALIADIWTADGDGAARTLVGLLAGPVCSFGWWAIWGPGLPPSAREPARSPAEVRA